MRNGKSKPRASWRLWRRKSHTLWHWEITVEIVKLLCGTVVAREAVWILTVFFALQLLWRNQEELWSNIGLASGSCLLQNVWARWDPIICVTVVNTLCCQLFLHPVGFFFWNKFLVIVRQPAQTLHTSFLNHLWLPPLCEAYLNQSGFVRTSPSIFFCTTLIPRSSFAPKPLSDTISNFHSIP